MSAFPSDASARPLVRLLFEEPALGTNEPLFASATELADYIVANHPEYEGKKPKNVATFIHQIARGERTAPDKLRDAIAMAIRARVENKDDQARWIERVNDLLSGAAHAEPRVTDADELWTRILDFARTASEQFIITARPAEARQTDDDEEVVGQARQLAKILQERLNLLAPEGAFTLPENVRYTFCFPDASTALAFWSRLFESMYFTTPACTRAEAIERLTELNKEHLMVLRIPEIACGCPVVVFEPRSAKPDAFVLFYFQRDGEGAGAKQEVSIARMDRNYTALWKKHVFLRINEREGVQEIKFESVLQ